MARLVGASSRIGGNGVPYGLGFFVAWLMITSFGGGRTITWPSTDYHAALSLSLLLALAAVAATFGLIRPNTAVSATRFE